MKDKQIIMNLINRIEAEEEPENVCALNTVIWKHIHHEKLNVLKEVLQELQHAEKEEKSEEKTAEIILGEYREKADLKTLIDEIPKEMLSDTAVNLQRILQYIDKRLP